MNYEARLIVFIVLKKLLLDLWEHIDKSRHIAVIGVKLASYSNGYCHFKLKILLNFTV